MKSNGLCILPAAVILTAAGAAMAGDETAGKGSTTPRTVYVQDFEVARPEGEPPGRPLGRIQATRKAGKASQSAASLSNAIAKRFSASGFPAHRLSPDAPLPKEGWLVRGVFYARDAKGGILTRPPAGGEGGSPNTEVTVSVADLAVDPASPFVVFGTAEVLRGQGAPVGWNPYVVAAKFVVNKAHSAEDIRKLAGEIVDTILNNKVTVEEKARAPQAP